MMEFLEWKISCLGCPLSMADVSAGRTVVLPAAGAAVH